MSRPIVIAYHLIWTVYGWWLPNDPRGSGSQRVACDVLAQLGDLHYGRKRIQPAGREVRAFYDAAAAMLKYPLHTLDVADRTMVAGAFVEVIVAERYTCYACAIMPDHVHILIRKHRHTAEEMIENLRTASRLRLSISPRWGTDHPIWTGGGGWKVFLDHPDEIRRTIPYIANNPLPLGLPRQMWPFVTRYDGWPLPPLSVRDASEGCGAIPVAACVLAADVDQTSAVAKPQAAIAGTAAGSRRPSDALPWGGRP